MRINKFIAANSAYSRRKADELIESGKVFVNNKKINQLGTKIDPKKDKVEIKGDKKINIEARKDNEKIYYILNKPKNYITTRSDEKNRKTVMDLLPKIPNLKPAGRLDKDSEGLLVLSNDGEFINRVTHPSFEKEKEYYVEIKGKLDPEEKNTLEKGVKIDGKITAPSQIKIISLAENESTLKITIHEGRNRQIRKMFGLINHNVKYLKRIRIGKLTLGNLKKGGFRKLTKKEINDF